MRSGDRFADDCLHRQLVFCFSREISFSEIIAEVPQVSLAKAEPSDHRERSLENGGALRAANSPFGNLAVRLVAAEISASSRIGPRYEALIAFGSRCRRK
jgi:hypothetical protein